MGGTGVSIRLVVEVLDHAPPDLTPSMCLVLVVLAELADDKTRRVRFPRGERPMDVLTRRTRLAEAGVRKAIRMLRERGIEVRVPIGTGRHGQPVFAAPGRAVDYRLPHLGPESKPAGPPSGEPTGSPSDQTGHSDPPGAVDNCPQGGQSGEPVGSPNGQNGEPVGSSGEPTGSPLSLLSQTTTTSAAERSPVEGLVVVVVEGLPTKIRDQLQRRRLTTACAALAAAGMTSERLDKLIRARSWDGAGPGAVITQLSEWAALPPETPRPQAPACDVCAGTGWVGEDDQGRPVRCACRPRRAAS